MPVYRLLGGRFRDRVRLYVDSAHSDYKQRAEEVRARGFTAIKFDLDDAAHPEKLDPWNWSVAPAELEDLVDRVHRIREAVGPRMDLAIDLHGRYDATAGMKFAHALEDLNLMWLEEPVPPENIDALKRITDSTRTPICAGENAYLRYGFRDMIERRRWTSSCPTSPSAAACPRAARSPTWRRATTSPSPRTTTPAP